MLNRIANSAARRELSQMASEIGGSAHIEWLLRLASQQVNARLSVKSLWLQSAPGQKPAEVAFAEHKVELLHLVDQLTTGFAQSQRSPTILNGLESGSKALGGAIEVSRFYRITEDIVQRHTGELVF